jgi:hypothetical protein
VWREEIDTFEQVSHHKMDLDDDSDNDSDYNPAEDKTNLDNDENDNDNEKKIGDISFSRKRKSNSLWDEMQEEEKVTLAKTSAKVSSLAASKPKVKKSKKNVKNEQILAQIFGKSVAKKLAVNSILNDNPEDQQSSETIKALAKESVSKLQKKHKVVETRKFAGTEIRYFQRSLLDSLTIIYLVINNL